MGGDGPKTWLVDQLGRWMNVGSDVRLMSGLNHVSGMPGQGKNLIVVAAVGQVLHVRGFDTAGQMVVDADETGLRDKTQQIENLRIQLAGLWPPHEVSGKEKEQLIATVTSIIGHDLKTARISANAIRAIAFGTFIAILYWIERLLVFFRDMGLFFRALYLKSKRIEAAAKLRESVVSGCFGFGIGLFSGAMMYSLISALVNLSHDPYTGGTMTLIVLGPPAALLVLLVAGVLRVGLLGDSVSDDTREWWASLSAWLLLCAIAWVAVLGCTLFGRYAIHWIGYKVGSFVAANTALVAGWLVPSIFGVITARSAKSSTTKAGGPGSGLPRQRLRCSLRASWSARRLSRAGFWVTRFPGSERMTILLRTGARW